MREIGGKSRDVAICINGQVRTLTNPRVFNNIKSAVLDSQDGYADLFMRLQFSEGCYKTTGSFNNAGLPNLRASIHHCL